MISVIIPTLNEAANLPRAIASLQGNSARHEMIVVDAGSTDGTQSLTEGLGARVLVAPRAQRATQMNLGASQAGGDSLLFLHADSVLGPGALDQIELALNDPAVGGGAFVRRFDSPSLILRFTCVLAAVRNRAIGWHLGDQGIFARTGRFVELRGFREIDRFEDLDFSRRLGRISRLVTLRPSVLSSARRFEKEGPALRTVRDFMLTLRYLQGKPDAISKVSAR